MICERNACGLLWVVVLPMSDFDCAPYRSQFRPAVEGRLITLRTYPPPVLSLALRPVCVYGIGHGLSVCMHSNATHCTTMCHISQALDDVILYLLLHAFLLCGNITNQYEILTSFCCSQHGALSSAT